MGRIQGSLAVARPQWVFRASGMTPLNHGAILACLGMVIGLYGVVYLEIARVPDRGFVPAAAAMAGKVLGPIGLAWLVATGRWPVRSFLVICVTNDVVWWVPFARYLRDSWPLFRSEVVAA